MGRLMLIYMLCLWAASILVVEGGDPVITFEWKVTYGNVAPLGVPVKGFLINGEFPGPNINSTTNNNVEVNVFNNLEEPLLFTWQGIQNRKNSWQDGVLGTMCPILPGTNFTYHFQVKDQIGSYMYYPVTDMHRAAGGFGGLRIHSRPLIPVPYDQPADEFTVMVGDWFNKGYTSLKKILDSGRNLGRADGLHINGKTAKGDGTDEPLFTMEAGKTYRISTSPLIFMSECALPADKEPRDYFLVASSRFTKRDLTATGIVRYLNGNGAPKPDLPKPPVGWAWSLNQFRTLRWNLTASAARPNPQGSYKYGGINITRTIRLANTAEKVDGKLRYAINGVSFVEPTTPFKLAEYYGVADKVFKYNNIPDEPPAQVTKAALEPIVVNITYKDFIEVIFENHETAIQSWNVDGYAFFAVAIETGTWSPEKRMNYNLLDAVSRHTIQVFPKSWAAVFITFDNAGMWNIRSEVWDRRYLGQQLYFSSLSPNRSLRDEYNMRDDTLVCGIVEGMPKPPPFSS
ncbi:hypothetical protein V6N12_015872 [Hibiscus sabdariffa]|uniref:L-ascorbate oxidase homolog n=1 Tax=Hibiscus sabdariffa TaxID=183260 RepID=A0ABR2DPE7_9ROSI